MFVPLPAINFSEVSSSSDVPMIASLMSRLGSVSLRTCAKKQFKALEKCPATNSRAIASVLS